ncbi:unnamed protein product [Urochloa humidicola]
MPPGAAALSSLSSTVGCCASLFAIHRCLMLCGVRSHHLDPRCVILIGRRCCRRGPGHAWDWQGGFFAKGNTTTRRAIGATTAEEGRLADHRIGRHMRQAETPNFRIQIEAHM